MNIYIPCMATKSGRMTISGKPVHVVCGSRGDSLVIITVYIPSPPKFKNPYERG